MLLGVLRGLGVRVNDVGVIRRAYSSEQDVFGRGDGRAFYRC